MMSSPWSAGRQSLATEYVPTLCYDLFIWDEPQTQESAICDHWKHTITLACSDFYFISKHSGYTQQKKHEVPYYSQHWVTANQPIQHRITDLLETGLSHSVNIDCRPATGKVAIYIRSGHISRPAVMYEAKLADLGWSPASQRLNVDQQQFVIIM